MTTTDVKTYLPFLEVLRNGQLRIGRVQLDDPLEKVVSNETLRHVLSQLSQISRSLLLLKHQLQLPLQRQ